MKPPYPEVELSKTLLSLTVPIEKVVISEVIRLVSSHTTLSTILNTEDQEQLRSLLANATGQANQLKSGHCTSLIKSIIGKVIFSEAELQLHIEPTNLILVLSGGKDVCAIKETHDAPPYIITLQMQLKRCGHGKKLIIRKESSTDTTSADSSLIKLIARAHMWFEEMKTGLSYKEIADIAKVDQRLVARTIQCAFLAPDITSAILKGQEPQSLSYQKLLRLPTLSSNWQEQRQLLGFI